MRRLTLLIATAAALAAPAAASAGGWATVGVNAPPANLGAGEEWRMQLDIRQHGVTPLEGVKPRVDIHNRKRRQSDTFAAEPAGKPGIYVAEVVFPAEGLWEVNVNDGFAATHGIPAITVGDTAPIAAAAGGGSGGDDWLLPLVLGLGLAGLTALAFGLRRRRPRPGSA